MAFITADRVRDTSTTAGSGAFSVSGTAPTGYQTFSAVLSVSNTFYYSIQHQTLNEWEVGLGTYSSANTFARTTIYSSSNSGSAVTFSAGTKDVFITMAAARSPQLDASGNVTALGLVPIRVLASTANSATPTLNTDSYDMMVITGQTLSITSFTTNLTGTPVNGQKLWISITGTAAVAIVWGAKFESSTVTLPSTTVTTARLDVGFVWNVATTTWRCVATA
jgi:hypothetical protein